MDGKQEIKRECERVMGMVSETKKERESEIRKCERERERERKTN